MFHLLSDNFPAALSSSRMDLNPDMSHVKKLACSRPHNHPSAKMQNGNGRGSDQGTIQHVVLEYDAKSRLRATGTFAVKRSSEIDMYAR